MLKYIAITGVVLIMTFVIIAHKQGRSQVLMVHSYNTDLEWVKQIDRGIARYWENNRSSVVVRRHYMDLKNHKDCNFYRKAANDVKLVIDEWQPNVVILADDLAQALVGSTYLNFNREINQSEFYDQIASNLASGLCPDKDKDFFFLKHSEAAKKVTLVFAGVNGDVTDYGYRMADNVTGIFENKNYNAIWETIRDLNASLAEDQRFTSIQLLSDASATAKSEQSLYEQFDWAPFEWQPPIMANNLEEWEAAVSLANQNKSLLLVANYLQIPGSKSPNHLIEWTENNATYPILGAATAFVEHGGMLSIAITGQEQGEVAAELAAQAISGQAISELPYRRAKQFIIGMNNGLVQKRNLKLPLTYEAFSRESNNFVEGKNAQTN